MDPDLFLLGLVQEVDAIFNLPYLVQNRNGEVPVELRQQTGTFGSGYVGSGIGRIVCISTHMTIPPPNEVFGICLDTFQELSGTLTDTTAEVLPSFYGIFSGFHFFDIGDHILPRRYSCGQCLVWIQQHIPYLQSCPVGCITLDQIVITQRVIPSEELIQRIPSQGIPQRILFLQRDGTSQLVFPLSKNRSKLLKSIHVPNHDLIGGLHRIHVEILHGLDGLLIVRLWVEGIPSIGSNVPAEDVDSTGIGHQTVYGVIDNRMEFGNVKTDVVRSNILSIRILADVVHRKVDCLIQIDTIRIVIDVDIRTEIVKVTLFRGLEFYRL